MTTPTSTPASAPASTVHDVVAIGAGPFNLGLACLADPVPDLDVVVLEARDRPAWHPGLLLDDATLQVPFLADLVTMTDPTSRWSFLQFLKESGHLYPFYVRESFYPLRREYDAYLRWAAEGLGCVRFGQAVVAVAHDGETYAVTTGTGEVVRGRRLVVGVGTRPHVPDVVAPLLDDDRVLHAADYLPHRERLRAARHVAVVGSGQSAAEVYRDLLAAAPEHDYELTWLTRSPRFFPMEYTKLTLELTSPEYTHYFQRLPEATRETLLREQRSLYRGISGDLVDAISDLHYQQRVCGQGPRTTLVSGSELTGGAAGPDGVRLDLHHVETDERFAVTADAVVLATGYRAGVPGFLDGVRDRLRLDDRGRFAATSDYAVDRTGREVFCQNAEEQTHGFVAPDLGMGAYRNAVILNSLTGREAYPVEKRVAVQSFGVPDHLRSGASA